MSHYEGKDALSYIYWVGVIVSLAGDGLSIHRNQGIYREFRIWIWGLEQTLRFRRTKEVPQCKLSTDSRESPSHVWRLDGTSGHNNLPTSEAGYI